MNKYVDIDGIQVLDVTPDYNRPLALVDLTVLNKLIERLPKQSFSGIKQSFREQISDARTLEILVQHAEDFIAFHNSVNLIREIYEENVKQVQAEEQVRVVGKIDLDDLDTYPRDHSEY